MKVPDFLMLREFATTLYPRPRNDWTTPAPMPCEAPVTMTVFCLLAISASLNSVVVRISTFSPIVLWLFRHVRNSGKGFHILQTKLHGYQKTKGRSMIHREALAVEVRGEQRLTMAGRCQVERHEVRIRISRGVEIDR